MMIKNFRELKVWQKSHELTLKIYELTASYPKEEIYGLVSQMRRCAVSVSANIVEGSKRQTTLDLCHFLNIAEGSLEELKYHLFLSRDLKYISVERYEKVIMLCEEVGRMIDGLIASLKRRKTLLSSHLSLLFTFLSLTTLTLLHASAFEAVGLGGRSLSMGNSFVAVSGDYESVFWNPAGIAHLKQKTFHSEYRNLYSMGILRYITAGYVHPGVGKGSVGFSWYRLDTVGDASFLDYAENTYVFSYGVPVLKSFSLGVNGKFFRVSSTVGGGGMGLDFGLLWKIKEPYLTIGAAVQDLNRPLITWDSGAKDRLPTRLRVGTSSRIFPKTLLTTQVAWQDKEKRSHHAGIEQVLFKEVLTLRAGGTERDNRWRFSWGVGINVKSLNLSYGWEREQFLGDTQVLSLSMRF